MVSGYPVMNDNILIAVDGSEASFKALDFAADLASQYDSNLILLHVVPEGGLPEGLRQWATVEHVENPAEWLYEQAVADNVLLAADERVRAKGLAKVERVVQHGEVTKQILDVAKRRSVDLIVMGTRGLSDLEGLFMGSVAHKVTHRAPCTVVSVR